MRIGRCFAGVTVAALAAVAWSNEASADQILVGQCEEFAACWNGPFVPFSTNLDGAELAALGLGSTQPLIATQTAEYVIRLGSLEAIFQTPDGPVIETLPDFSGGYNLDPCNYCETDTVGDYTIPADATSAVISGTFGNSVVNSSAGVDVCIGSGPCAFPPISTPEPVTLALFGAGLVGAAGLRRRRNMRKSA